jgi:hypothetical protein
MPVQMNCCNGDTQLSAGEQFEFVNNLDVACNITNCSPPLVDSSYTVPAAPTSGSPSTCPAQVQDDAQPGNYNISVDCCTSEHTPIIIIQG